MKNQRTRRLAAVMFTDIVGYTALMQQDENTAAKVRTHHRKEFQQHHKTYNGEIVQYFGDGTLSVFQSGVEAVQCAIALQKALQQGEPVPLRIGLHVGDIVFDGTEIYGDGVNFASRIESMGVAGAILLSGKLNDELKNHKDISTISLGHFELKNISQPVEVFAVANEGITVPEQSKLKGKPKPNDKTIAVLPFVNMSNNEENEYFSDGITEEIINALAKIQNLKVTSRTSSFFFKNKNIPITQIGKELNVSAILEGSVRRSGDLVRITAQLIQTEDDFHFWSETWDRKLENIFEIQDEVSLLIADKLREHFGHFEIQEHLVKKQTDSIDAYEYSLKAKFHSNKWNLEDMQLAISLYQKALELDPNHTKSLVGLADAYSFMATCGFMSFEEGWGKTAQLINQALQIDDQLPGAYHQLANLSFFTACDFNQSYKHTKKAIDINPNYVEAQQFMSFLYILSGEKEKSRQHLDIALSIDPLSQETLFFSAYLDYMLEDYTKSLKQLASCLKDNPKNIPAHAVTYLCLLKLGRYDEVIHYFDGEFSDVVILGEKTGAIALAYALKKDEANTAKYLNLLIVQSKEPEGFTADSYLFMMYAAMGDTEKAFDWIRKGIENKSSLLMLRFADPMVNAIKDDPRYKEYQKVIFSLDSTSSKTKKKKELLNDNEIANYSKRLLHHIEEEKPYLDPNLSLRSLAEQTNIHPNQLSWLINENFEKNFNEFINQYRVETFKQIAKDPKNSHVTLIGLAYDSGFNSKTVFNTYFKKETGLTPKQFLNS